MAPPWTIWNCTATTHTANAPLAERIAARFAIAPACVVSAAGCSFANHLAMAALVEPGDEVLVEDPTYELLVATLEYLRARITRFERRPEAAWRLDPEDIAARVTPAHAPGCADQPAQPVERPCRRRDDSFRGGGRGKSRRHGAGRRSLPGIAVSIRRRRYIVSADGTLS
ncbi:MAG: aminotransferase class I/II-fold pyridoxal phosphate-dependent enzyme [Rhodospirillales bacterium]